MYKIAIPLYILQHNFDREQAVRELRRAGAQRVFLGLDALPLDETDLTRMLAPLGELIPYFKAQGFEVGVWYWTFWRSGFSAAEAEELLMADADGSFRTTQGSIQTAIRTLAGFCCPSSPRFLEHAAMAVARIARYAPDIIMFDDDFRYAFLGKNPGCFCSRHLRRVSDAVGRELTGQELYDAAFSGGPNDIRSTWLDTLGDDLKDLAILLRRAVDSVDPAIRLAYCSCISDWDNDGVDSVTLAKLLAGGNRPLLRLIGAPYWAVNRSWGNRLQNVIELERMEYAWCAGEDIEIMLEGDAFPRPRHVCPASYLELFTTALAAAGVGEYALKYMIDYTSSASYEQGYIDRHLKNADRYAAIDRFFSDKELVGVRVYEAMEKFREADLTAIENPGEYSVNLFFSVAARVLADNTIPTVYSGSGVGIAFGENARHLPPEALSGGLILDIRAAKLLTQQGIDVGLRGVGEEISNDLLYFPAYDDVVRTNFGKAYVLEPDAQAQIVTFSLDGDRKVPDTYLYENADGSRFLVFSFDSATVTPQRYRSYLMQKLLYHSIEWLGRASLPVKCAGNPDAYILCRQGSSGMAVGLWNLHADRMLEPVLELDRAYTSAEFVGCSGILCGDRVLLSDIPAFDFALVNLHV